MYSSANFASTFAHVHFCILQPKKIDLMVFCNAAVLDLLEGLEPQCLFLCDYNVTYIFLISHLNLCLPLKDAILAKDQRNFSSKNLNETSTHLSSHCAKLIFLHGNVHK